MFAVQLVPENLKSSGSDLLWIAGVVAAVTALAKSPLGKPFRFAWQRLVIEPRDDRRAAVVARHVAPLIDASRAASLAQHEEQNRNHADLVGKFDGFAGKFDGLVGRVDELAGSVATHAEQLKAGAEVMRELRGDVNKALNQHPLPPPPPPPHEEHPT